ncbi:HEAT repeat domain-containing protein [Actinomadura sp. WMMA1423]|uniref:HEAT repeat domain-containing protein n=1 Tax=Actinomadura sp. WMMA1423 TaxID=2591108 RepID=UPI001146AA8E|nr:HEAT repeat domain-containing protein [Actinomadura sp. WMMA1423]
MGDPLAGLDDIDWAGLDHAYGSAEDVPGLLRALSSLEEEERDAALGELFTNIFHQGRRYGAAAAAVPFLLALASHPGTPERTGPLYLAAALAIGYDAAHLPSGVGITAWREEVARLRETDPAAEARRLEALVTEAANQQERRARAVDRDHFDFAWALRSAEAELAAYDAVRAGLTTVLTLLGDDDAGVRATAAYTVGWFPEEAAASLPALEALLEAEQDQNVIAHALVAAGLLDGRALLPLFREHLASTEPLSRWAAAIALARLSEDDAPIIAELASSCASPPEGDMAFLEGDLRLYSALTLAALEEAPPEAVDAVLDGLSRTSDEASFPMAEAALRLTFGSPASPLPPFAELTTAQQRTVQTIAELPPSSWQWANLLEILDVWGLPTVQYECRRYAGLA